MDERLLDLEMTLTQLSVSSGVDRDTIRRWRTSVRGTGRPAPRMALAVEKRLYWAPGSIQATLDGGDPVAIEKPKASEDTGDGDPIARIRAMDLLTSEEKDAMIGVILTLVADAAAKQERRADHYPQRRGA